MIFLEQKRGLAVHHHQSDFPQQLLIIFFSMHQHIRHDAKNVAANKSLYGVQIG